MLDLFALLACGLAQVCEKQDCDVLSYRGIENVVCVFRQTDVETRTHHLASNGEAYGYLSTLEQNLAKPALMLMNGGMYHEGLDPVGLYVESGRLVQKISTKGGRGNFHLLPNGVFWIKDGKARVTETKAFRRQSPKPDYATQSGPMLVINGALHPRFLEHSDSLKIRNGAGVSKDGKTLVFAISTEPVNFWTFGKLFQDYLDSHNALFLDGTVSTIRTPQYRISGWRQVGPMIGVYNKR